MISDKNTKTPRKVQQMSDICLTDFGVRAYVANT